MAREILRSSRLACALLSTAAMNARNFLLVALAACGGSSETTTDALDAAPACAPSETTTTVMIPSVTEGTVTSFETWTLDDAAGPHEVIAHTRDAAGAIHVSRLDSEATELAILPDASGYTFSAVAIPGSACALVSSSKTGLAYACAGQPLDTASSVRDISGDPLFPVQTASSLLVYTQTFASFTEIERSGVGAWTEHEQFESSISFPTDALLVNGQPVACFIDAGDRAVVARGDGRAASSVSASWCKLALAGDTLHVLTDAGYCTVAASSMGDPNGTLALAPVTLSERPTRLVLLGGVPHALVRGDDGVQLVPMPSGAPITLAAPTGDNAVLAWDAGTQALVEISSKLDTSGPGPLYPQTIHFETRCVP
jgi:hypothetical protein